MIQNTSPSNRLLSVKKHTAPLPRRGVLHGIFPGLCRTSETAAVTETSLFLSMLRTLLIQKRSVFLLSAGFGTEGTPGWMSCFDTTLASSKNLK